VAMCSIEDNQVESNDLQKQYAHLCILAKGSLLIINTSALLLMFGLPLRIYGCEEEMAVEAVGTTRRLLLLNSSSIFVAIRC
jgi:hypothetical protein